MHCEDASEEDYSVFAVEQDQKPGVNSDNVLLGSLATR